MPKMLMVFRNSKGQLLQWQYADADRPRGFCYDCRRRYSTWPDFSVDDDVWEAINPTEFEGAGLLCEACIRERVAHLGMTL